MKQLVNSYKQEKKDKVRTAVLRMEMDYELATLYEAMQNHNEEQKKLCKQRLAKIRQELIKLRAL